jgi:hypothetical protein
MSGVWEGVLREKLEALGITIRVAHFSGDSSYPVEYTLSVGAVSAGGEPTLDLAMVALLGELLSDLRAIQEGEEPILRDCPFCHGAHYSGQQCPLKPRSIGEALSETPSEFANSFSEETQLHRDDEPTSGPRRVDWNELLDS